MRLSTRVAAAVAAATGLAAGPALAGMSQDHLLAASGDEAVVAHAPYAVLVATVAEVPPRQSFTRGSPPRATLQVHEVLRGEARSGRLKATWRPPPHDIDYGDIEKNPRYLAWKSKPMAAPVLGQKLIVVGTLFTEEISIAPTGSFPFTEEKRAWALKAIANGRKADEQAKEEAARGRQDAAAKQALVDRWADGLAKGIPAAFGAADLVAEGYVAWPGQDAPKESGFRVQCHFTSKRLVKGTLSPDEKVYAKVYLPPEFFAGESLLVDPDRTRLVVFGKREGGGTSLVLVPAKGTPYVLPATPAVLGALEAASKR